MRIEAKEILQTHPEPWTVEMSTDSTNGWSIYDGAGDEVGQFPSKMTATMFCAAMRRAIATGATLSVETDLVIR